MIRFLHIIVDDKFPKGTIAKYNQIANIDNTCAIFNLKNVKLAYVGDIEGLFILHSRKEIKSFFRDREYDFVLFHSLPADYWPYIQYIPDDKKVIWWAWGYDLYNLPFGQKPFIKVDLLKPLSRQWLKSLWLHRLNIYINLVRYPLYKFFRDKMIKRIDYFQPVISSEYLLMKNNIRFTAQEYYCIKKSTTSTPKIIPEHAPNGDIILGNSAHETNNHLDIVAYLNNAYLTNRCIYVPVSYGSIKYKMYLKANMHINGAKIEYIETMLPKEEYFSLVSKCSYFVSGVMRQQSMANLNYCMRNGIRVFLYKDSLPYLYYKSIGCIVNSIEDINVNSFRTPLSSEEAEWNRQCLKKESARRKAIWEDFVKNNNKNNN